MRICVVLLYLVMLGSVDIPGISFLEGKQRSGDVGWRGEWVRPGRSERWENCT